MNIEKKIYSTDAGIAKVNIDGREFIVSIEGAKILYPGIPDNEAITKVARVANETILKQLSFTGYD